MLDATRKKIIYIQYANPACYPPLEHSSRILANHGWRVLFLGTGCFGAANNFCLSPHINIVVRKLPFCKTGWVQKLHYIWFCIWVMWRTLRWRPKWVYASDPFSCPVALILSYSPEIKIIYHEHDSPNLEQNGASRISSFMKFVLWARRRLARRIELSILPNEERKERFKVDIGKDIRVLKVWNCPQMEEVSPERPALRNNHLRIIYEGSIVPHRLPLTVLSALAGLPDTVKLVVVGYETEGYKGYVQKLKKTTDKLGISNKVEFVDVIQERSAMMALCKECDVGLSFFPKHTADFNYKYMVGASNKPFEYLASGLALVVSALPDWKKMYVEPGYGWACDPDDSESIACAIRWFLAHPQDMRKMGERGRQKVLTEWNYEKEFKKVIDQIDSSD